VDRVIGIVGQTTLLCGGGVWNGVCRAPLRFRRIASIVARRSSCVIDASSLCCSLAAASSDLDGTPHGWIMW